MKSTGKVRLVDIAKKANVSQTVVGKVLNGGSERIRVSDQTVKRIMAAAAELDYQPNMAASILAGGSSGLIGVLTDPGMQYRNARLSRELESIASQLGYRLIVCSAHDNVRNLYSSYKTLQKYGIDGAICIAHDYPEFEKDIIKAFEYEPRIVFHEKPYLEHAPYVATSRTKALTGLISDMYKQGRRRFALVHGRLTWQSELHLVNEFREAMNRNNLEVNEDLIVSYPREVVMPSERSDYVIANMIEKHRPDFLFVDDARHANTIHGKLLHRGWRMPDDILIYGGNDDPFFRCPTPPIASLDPQYGLIARSLLELLLNKDENKEPVIINSVYRKSTHNKG